MVFPGGESQIVYIVSYFISFAIGFVISYFLLKKKFEKILPRAFASFIVGIITGFLLLPALTPLLISVI